MTIAIFVVKLNISVSRISQNIFFFGRWFNYLDVPLQIPVGYYFVQIIMKCHSATVHHSNLTFIVFTRKSRVKKPGVIPVIYHIVLIY